MHDPTFQNEYVLIICQRCGAQNNGAKVGVCRTCGCQLFDPVVRRASLTESPMFKWWLIVGVLVGLVIFRSAYHAYLAHINDLTQKLNNPVSTVVKIEPPKDSWYKPSIWNFYREQPTLEEIVKKNIEVTGMPPKPSEVKTTMATAVVRSADGGPNSDDFERPVFVNEGSFELLQTSPDKIRVKVFFKGPERSVETLRGYNGWRGWQRQTIWEGLKVDLSFKELVLDDLNELRGSSPGYWRIGNDEKNLIVQNPTQVNGKMHYVVRKEDPSEPATLYFDAVTGFLTKIDFKDNLTCFLTSYQEKNGVKLPSKVYYRMSRDGKLMWIKLEDLDWRMNEPIDDQVYEKPADPR